MYELTSVYAVDHLKAGVDRAQRGHAGRDVGRSDAREKRHGESVQGILNVTLGGERYGGLAVGSGRSPAISYGCDTVVSFDRCDLERGVRRVTACPGYAFRPFGERGCYEVIVGAIHHVAASFHKLSLLAAFLFDRAEITAVGGSDVGEDANPRLDYFFQPGHFAGLRYSGLDYCGLGVGGELPERQWDACLGVEAAWRAHCEHIGTYQPVYPLLDCSLAAAAGDGNDSGFAFAATVCGDCLQCLERRLCNEKIGLGHCDSILRHMLDHEVANPAQIELRDVSVAVARGGAQGKEKCAGRLEERTAVGEQRCDFIVMTDP